MTKTVNDVYFPVRFDCPAAFYERKNIKKFFEKFEYHYYGVVECAFNPPERRVLQELLLFAENINNASANSNAFFKAFDDKSPNWKSSIDFVAYPHFEQYNTYYHILIRCDYPQNFERHAFKCWPRKWVKRSRIGLCESAKEARFSSLNPHKFEHENVMRLWLNKHKFDFGISRCMIYGSRLLDALDDHPFGYAVCKPSHKLVKPESYFIQELTKDGELVPLPKKGDFPHYHYENGGY